MKNINMHIWILLMAIAFTFASCNVKEEAEDIVEEITDESPSGEIVLLKDDYNPGEEIKLAYTLKTSTKKEGWIGISPSGAAGVKETGTDAGMKTITINKEIGVLTLKAPEKPGDYNISLTTKDTTGKPEEVTSVSITVLGNETKTDSTSPSIKLEKDVDTFAPGEDIMITFNTPSSYVKSAWIGLVPSIVEHDNAEKNYEESIIKKEIAGNTNGKMTFTAPDMPGVYNIRMYTNKTSGKEVEDIQLIVK